MGPGMMNGYGFGGFGAFGWFEPCLKIVSLNHRTYLVIASPGPGIYWINATPGARSHENNTT